MCGNGSGTQDCEACLVWCRGRPLWRGPQDSATCSGFNVLGLPGAGWPMLLIRSLHEPVSGFEHGGLTGE